MRATPTTGPSVLVAALRFLVLQQLLRLKYQSGVKILENGTREIQPQQDPGNWRGHVTFDIFLVSKGEKLHLACQNYQDNSVLSAASSEDSSRRTLSGSTCVKFALLRCMQVRLAVQSTDFREEIVGRVWSIPNLYSPKSYNFSAETGGVLTLGTPTPGSRADFLWGTRCPVLSNHPCEVLPVPELRSSLHAEGELYCSQCRISWPQHYVLATTLVQHPTAPHSFAVCNVMSGHWCSLIYNIVKRLIGRNNHQLMLHPVYGNERHLAGVRCE